MPVVAAGAGQDLPAAAAQRDASGNVKLLDIGRLLKDRLVVHFEARGVAMVLRYFEPSDQIRGCPADTENALLCDRMARHAVHAAMAGKTGLVISSLNGQFVHLPIAEITQGGKRLDLEGGLWRAMLLSTGKPARLG